MGERNPFRIGSTLFTGDLTESSPHLREISTTSQTKVQRDAEFVQGHTAFSPRAHIS